MPVITTPEALRAIYDQCSEASLVKVTRRLTAEYQRMIEASPFVAVATSGPGGLDCSPRGDAGQVVFVDTDTTLLLPDWRGNNRVDTLENLIHDPRIALMFLIPGSTSTLRVNGTAQITNDEAMVNRFTMDGKHPRTVAVITIGEVYFQCARAVMRADLWNPERAVDPKSLPTAGQMLKAAKADFDAETYDREWPDRAKKSMW